MGSAHSVVAQDRGMTYVGGGGQSGTSGDFITLLRVVRSVKLVNCLVLEFSI